MWSCVQAHCDKQEARSAGDPLPHRARKLLATAHCRKRSTPPRAEKMFASDGGKPQDRRSCGRHSAGAALCFPCGWAMLSSGMALPVGTVGEFRGERKKPSTSSTNIILQVPEKRSGATHCKSGSTRHARGRRARGLLGSPVHVFTASPTTARRASTRMDGESCWNCWKHFTVYDRP